MFDDNVPQIFQRFDQPLPTNQVLLPVVGDVPSADVPVVGPQRCEDIADRYVKGGQAVRVECHLIGLQFTAERVDLNYAGDASELVVDIPIQNRA